MKKIHYLNGKEIRVGDLVSARYNVGLGIKIGSLGIVKRFEGDRYYKVGVDWIDYNLKWMSNDELEFVRRDAEELLTWI